ncbi:hypothetical protein E2C01_034915 [Portunus trituberculatus]|uniref:Secreted protein n=1 Tax=Portunus trituberculatus TaxID=210409 RepID=A0A5B7F7N1_PORTR|nr:hypothetical protein [Portunus trituberculatus]
MWVVGVWRLCVVAGAVGEELVCGSSQGVADTGSPAAVAVVRAIQSKAWRRDSSVRCINSWPLIYLDQHSLTPAQRTRAPPTAPTPPRPLPTRHHPHIASPLVIPRHLSHEGAFPEGVGGTARGGSRHAGAALCLSDPLTCRASHSLIGKVTSYVTTTTTTTTNSLSKVVSTFDRSHYSPNFN